MGGLNWSAANRRSLGVGLGLVVLLALGAWIAGGQIRSPAQVAAETAAPDPGPITVPVERRVLSSEVMARGTVRYGSPQPVVLATSQVKQGSGDSEIVTEPPRRGSGVAEGTVAMSVSGRPVFVLQGTQPSHRDIGPGAGDRTWGSSSGPWHGWGFRPGSSTIATTARPQPPSRPGTRARAGRRSAPPTASSRRCAQPTPPPRRHATCTFRPGSQSRARHTGSARGARTGAHRPRGGSGRRGHRSSRPQHGAAQAQGRQGRRRRTTGIQLAVQTLDATTSLRRRTWHSSARR